MQLTTIFHVKTFHHSGFPVCLSSSLLKGLMEGHPSRGRMVNELRDWNENFELNHYSHPVDDHRWMLSIMEYIYILAAIIRISSTPCSRLVPFEPRTILKMMEDDLSRHDDRHDGR